MTRALAKTLRRNMTPAERKLWGGLRKNSLNGYRFQRQVPIGPYVVDFLCRSRKLIVEVDGATHGEDHEVAHDKRRTAFLENNGYSVLRVQNASVYESIGDVMDQIYFALLEQPEFYVKSGTRVATPSALRAAPPSEKGERHLRKFTML